MKWTQQKKKKKLQWADFSGDVDTPNQDLRSSAKEMIEEKKESQEQERCQQWLLPGPVMEAGAGGVTEGSDRNLIVRLAKLVLLLVFFFFFSKGWLLFLLFF